MEEGGRKAKNIRKRFRFLTDRPHVNTPTHDLNIQQLHIRDCLRPATWTDAAKIGIHKQLNSAQTVRESLRSLSASLCSHSGS